MSAIVRRGGERFARSIDPLDIELWLNGKCVSTWQTDDFPWDYQGLVNIMLDMAFEAGKEVRSKEISVLLGVRSKT